MRISLAVAAMAMAGVGAMKTYGAYTAANMSDSELLLAENVEALSNEEGCKTDTEQRREECFRNNGQWGYASIYKGTITLTRKKGIVYTHGDKEYSLSYEITGGSKSVQLVEYVCTADQSGTSSEDKNCCTKQGLYIGENKIG